MRIAAYSEVSPQMTPLRISSNNKRIVIVVRGALASSLDGVTRNRGFLAMISSIPLRYIAATCLDRSSLRRQ